MSISELIFGPVEFELRLYKSMNWSKWTLNNNEGTDNGNDIDTKKQRRLPSDDTRAPLRRLCVFKSGLLSAFFYACRLSPGQRKRPRRLLSATSDAIEVRRLIRLAFNASAFFPFFLLDVQDVSDKF